MINGFLCPICNHLLVESEGSFKCCSNHCFDKSGSGYVNLLINGRKKGHGDNKIMIKARHNFLQKGYYKDLKDSICTEVKKYAKNKLSLLDSGCGEGYYTEGMYVAVSENESGEVYAIDVSKEALKIAAKNCKKVKFAVASAYKLPFEDESFDIVTSLFAPLACEEFYRVLKKEGIFITVIPLENHLYQLKQAVYDTPYKNKPGNTEIKGFELLNTQEVKKEIHLNSNEDIKNLFMMTPYYYKTSESDQKKLDDLEKLTTETEFLILTYKKIDS